MQKSPTKPQIHKTMVQTLATRGGRHILSSAKTPWTWETPALIYASVSAGVCTCALLTRAHSTGLAVNRTRCSANSAGDSESVPLPGNAPKRTLEFLYCCCWNLDSTTHAINEPRIRAQRWNSRDHLHGATYLLLPVPAISTWLFLFMFIRPFTYFFFFFTWL